MLTIKSSDNVGEAAAEMCVVRALSIVDASNRKGEKNVIVIYD